MESATGRLHLVDENETISDPDCHRKTRFGEHGQDYDYGRGLREMSSPEECSSYYVDRIRRPGGLDTVARVDRRGMMKEGVARKGSHQADGRS